MKKTLKTRILAFGLVFIMAFMLPAGPLVQGDVQAASKKTPVYIKDVRLFTERKYGKYVEKWIEEQGSDWHVAAERISEGGEGAFQMSVGASIVYQTTTDPKEAITDLALMNEKGNYDFEAYEIFLKEQKSQYRDMVNDLKTMRAEYKKNYENKVDTAVKAHDLMNMYIEDDSDMLLGDLLLTADDDKLTDVLLQANGSVVIFIERELASACDTGKTTWLDRMSQIGSYDTLREKFIRVCNNNAASADATMDNQ